MKIKRILTIIISLVFIFVICITFKGKKAKAESKIDDYYIYNVHVRNVTTNSAELYWNDNNYTKYFIIEKYSENEYKKIAEVTDNYYRIDNLNAGQYTDEYAVIGCDDRIENEKWFLLNNSKKKVEILTKPEGISSLRCVRKNIIDKDPNRSYIDLKWDKCDGADQYDIYVDNKLIMSNCSNSTSIYLYKIARNPFNKAYSFKVVPVAKKNKLIEYGKEDCKSFYIRRDMLSVQQKLTYDENSITITWENADYYKKIYIYVLKDDKWALFDSVNEKDRKYVFNNLKANTSLTLCFKDSSGNVLDNIKVITPPKKLENVKVCDVSDNSATLKWEYEENEWYGIFKYNNKGKKYIKLATVYNTGEYICKNLNPYEKNELIVSKRVSFTEEGEKYYYSATGSPSVTFYTKLCKIKNLHITKMQKDNIQLAWNKDEFADGYNIYVYDKEGKLITKEKTSECNYTYKCDKEQIDIVINVEAFFETTNNGKKEEIVSHINKINAANYLKAPTKVHTENKVTGFVKLVWDKVDYANKYEVYFVKKNSDNKKEYVKVVETKKQFYEFDLNSLKNKTTIVIKAIFDNNECRMESDYSQEFVYIEK